MICQAYSLNLAPLIMKAPAQVMKEIARQFPNPQEDLLSSDPHKDSTGDDGWIGNDIFKQLQEAIKQNTVFNLLPNGEKSPSNIGPWEISKWCHLSGSGGILVTLMRGSGKVTIASIATNEVNITITMYPSNNSQMYKRIVALKHTSVNTLIGELVAFVQTYQVFLS